LINHLNKCGERERERERGNLKKGFVGERMEVKWEI